MKQYFTGFFTAVCLTASVFLFMGSQNKNLGEIEADMITITSELGTTYLIGGGIVLENQYGKDVFTVGISDDGGGFLSTYNTDGKETSYLGTGEGGVGLLTTNNAGGKQTSYLGTGEGGGGHLSTYNADGKETSYLGTTDDGSGLLMIENMDGELIAGFGASPDNGKDGEAVLFDRYGDVGWTASGKQ